jgi:rhodanese-related sulfurtransferase
MKRTTIDDLLAAARQGLQRLSPVQAAQAVAAGALLVDTRCAELRKRDGVVPGAAHIPLSVLFWRLDPDAEHRDPDAADLDRQVVLLCEHGYSSSMAAATLRQLGYTRATDVIGGFEAWRAYGLPVTA